MLKSTVMIARCIMKERAVGWCEQKGEQILSVGCTYGKDRRLIVKVEEFYQVVPRYTSMVVKEACAIVVIMKEARPIVVIMTEARPIVVVLKEARPIEVVIMVIKEARPIVSGCCSGKRKRVQWQAAVSECGPSALQRHVTGQTGELPRTTYTVNIGLSASRCCLAIP